MNGERKQRIVTQLLERIATKQLSQRKASKQIGISDALLSQMINGVNNPALWEQISPEKWLQAERWTGHTGWRMVETRTVKRVWNVCNDAQYNKKALAISDEPGVGKSASLKWYANSTAGVYYVECEEYWTKKIFLQKILASMGSATEGSVAELVDRVVNVLLADDDSLLILDEADKLKDNVIELFKTFYNKTEGRAGFVLSGAPYFKARVIKGCNRDKQAYKEIRSRLGGDFIPMSRITPKELEAICLENGVPAHEVPALLARIDRVTDLRVVKRTVETYLIEQQQNFNRVAA